MTENNPQNAAVAVDESYEFGFGSDHQADEDKFTNYDQAKEEQHDEGESEHNKNHVGDGFLEFDHDEHDHDHE